MEFKELTLNNIGPYKGRNHFTFNSTNGKNTILIGGKNGSGKTTFLKSIRLALYGPLAFGYKTESKEYLSRVSMLFNNDALKDYNNKFYIQVKLLLDENFNRIEVNIIRSWFVRKSNISENVVVMKNNVPLNDAQKNDFFEYLRTTIPPSLLELCFFDGEDISKLSNDELLSTYLKDLSIKLFNLDLFKNLEKDILNYLSEVTKSTQGEKIKSEKNIIEKKLNEKKSALENVTYRINSLKMELDEIESKYKKIKFDFSVHGGLIYEERQQIEKEIFLLENKRKQTNDNIKIFIAKYLPFFIASPILTKLINQLKDEENFFLSEVLKNKINHLNINDLFVNTKINPDSTLEKELKNNLIKQLTSNKNVHIIHNASKTEANQVQHIFRFVNKKQLQSLVELINENNNDLQKLNKLKARLSDNENTVEFQDMILEMEQLNQKMIYLKSKIDDLVRDREFISNEINELNKKYDKVKSDLYRFYKTKSSVAETEKVLRVSKKFQENQLRRKLKDSEYFSTIMFKELLQKKSFISKIKIDPKNFTISLLDANQNEINKSILSAGEKELMVLAIIWGTIKSSNKKLPFVLDTLLGRLDKEHKTSVITKLIPKLGSQVIILATDSEIDEKLYKEILPFTSNQFTLVYDSLNKKTNIEHHFFYYKS